MPDATDRYVNLRQILLLDAPQLVRWVLETGRARSLRVALEADGCDARRLLWSLTWEREGSPLVVVAPEWRAALRRSVEDLCGL